MYCSYREFSVKEELREAKPPSVEGCVVAEHAHLSHFRAHIYGWRNADKQTNAKFNKSRSVRLYIARKKDWAQVDTEATSRIVRCLPEESSDLYVYDI